MTTQSDAGSATALAVRLPGPVEGALLRDSERALGLEWLEPDGGGGFAMGSVLGCPTRRHHGLLVLRPPGLERRHVLLAGLAETVEHGSGRTDLDTLRRDGAFVRHGHLALERFELEPIPSWTYRVAGHVLRRELLATPGRVLLRYTLVEGRGPLRLALAPRLAFRDADRLTEANERLEPAVTVENGLVRVAPYAGLPRLDFLASAGDAALRVAPRWERRIEFTRDLERGYQGTEDQWLPVTFEVALGPGKDLVLAAGLELAPEPLVEAFARLAEERRTACEAAGPGPSAALARAARRFLYTEGDHRGVIAGYPWLHEWGRDTFIALPGLTLPQGDLQGCADVLEAAVARLDHGLLPKHYAADPVSDHYGAADTSLWFARAVRLFGRAGGSRTLIEERLLPALLEIGRAFLDGTELGLHVDDAGLLHVGAPTVCTTWMDARVDGTPHTPRHGYPVEVQALWYGLLTQLEEYCLERGGRREAERWSDLRRRAATSFIERFWDADRRVLLDVWRPDGGDRAIRPNMVIAAALENSPLTVEARAGIVECVERELLTPRGLRSLSPDDPSYEGRCVGCPSERDRRRHQGSAWPWLMGFLIEARMRAFGADDAGLGRLEMILHELIAELGRGCLGSIAELYDGDPPHRPAETPAMAKSVGELARALDLIEGVRE
jgi:predicted glycogen debranching enzyme